MTTVLVTGSSGQLGTELMAVARREGHRPVGLSRHAGEPCDLTDPAQVRDRVHRARPDLVVHCGAWTAVDLCEGDPPRAMAVNRDATAHVAAAAEEVGAHVVYLSTDYVYDGTKATPYVETDPVNPLSVYGRSKLAGERELPAGATIVRTSWVVGAHGANMLKTVLALRAREGPLRFVGDQVGHPTFTADLAPVLLALGRDRAPGIFHVTNQGAVSWHGFARAVLEAVGDDPERVQAITTAELDPPRPAPRPANSVLENAALAAAGYPPLPPFTLSLGRALEKLDMRG